MVFGTWEQFCFSRRMWVIWWGKNISTCLWKKMKKLRFVIKKELKYVESHIYLSWSRTFLQSISSTSLHTSQMSMLLLNMWKLARWLIGALPNQWMSQLSSPFVPDSIWRKLQPRASTEQEMPRLPFQVSWAKIHQTWAKFTWQDFREPHEDQKAIRFREMQSNYLPQTVFLW